MTVLGYLLKLRRGLELAFSANAPYLIFYQLTMFQYRNFFLLKISNKICYQVLI